MLTEDELRNLLNIFLGEIQRRHVGGRMDQRTIMSITAEVNEIWRRLDNDNRVAPRCMKCLAEMNFVYPKVAVSNHACNIAIDWPSTLCARCRV